MTKYTLNLTKGYKKQPLPGRNEWLEALRSGKYRQARESLKTPSGRMCCLGVLSKLQGRLCKIDGRWNDGPIETMDAVLRSDNPADSALKQSGCFPYGVTVTIDDEYEESLAGCNDHGLSFLQIADIIERVWKHVPTKKRP